MSGTPPAFVLPDGNPTLHDVEMKYIEFVLAKHGGDKPAAAKELGVSLKTIYNKLNQLRHRVGSEAS